MHTLTKYGRERTMRSTEKTLTIMTCILALCVISGLSATAQDQAEAISAEYPFESNYVEVNGSKIHYVDVGEGDPIIFLHGNPTSSYLWRNVIPHLQSQGRCIAPDLIGMGKSDKPDIEYTFFDHVKYIEGFIEALDLKNVTFVIHDWGSGIGFHYAMGHEDNVKAIAFMEAFVQVWDSYESMPPQGEGIFRQMRKPDVGWNMVVKQNMFVEQILPSAAGRELTDAEMEHYRAPFLEESSRKPVWKWPNEVSIGGEPADTTAAINAYNAKLQKSELPKLMLTVAPGFLLGPDRAQWCKDNLKNLDTVHLGPGSHFIQEQYPHEIGEAIAQWYKKL